MKIMDLMKADIEKAEKMFDAGKLSIDDVRLMPGNTKTGKNVYTLSLMPVIDCVCMACAGDCYDLRHDVIQKGCRWQRAVNHVIHKNAPNAFWYAAIGKLKALEAKSGDIALRINVGGDVTSSDLEMIEIMARELRKAKVLLFTKNYDGLAKLFSRREKSVPWPKSLHVVVSRWVGVVTDSIGLKATAPDGFHYIESRVRWGDRMPKCLKGNKEAASLVEHSDKIASKLFSCPGDCGVCLAGKTGCFSRRLKGVFFDAH